MQIFNLALPLLALAVSLVSSLPVQRRTAATLDPSKWSYPVNYPPHGLYSGYKIKRVSISKPSILS